MQFGLTIPLQRRLKIQTLRYGEPLDRLYCWDLHLIPLRGRGSLLAVHCASRYACVVYGMTDEDWSGLAGKAAEAIRRSLLEAGLGEGAAAAYFERTGAPYFTRTHGRREVAFLNRAWDDVNALDHAVDPGGQAQPLLERAVNALPCRCAGEFGLAPARDRLLRLMA